MRYHFPVDGEYLIKIRTPPAATTTTSSAWASRIRWTFRSTAQLAEALSVPAVKAGVGRAESFAGTGLRPIRSGRHTCGRPTDLEIRARSKRVRASSAYRS